MGLDFVVLQRDDDDSPENWPAHELDARRANDPDPIVQAKLREIYENDFSPEGMAASAEFQGWTGMPLPASFIFWIFAPIGILVLWPILLIQDLFRLMRDKRRKIPSFEAWRATLLNRDPPPVVIEFGPNCPPGGRPYPAAIVQWYGFRGRVVQPEYNMLVAWWEQKAGLEMMFFYFNELVPDGPRSEVSFEDLELDDCTIADMAALFEKMEADCVEAFPELAAAADENPHEEAEFGPYPDRGLDDIASPVDLTMIRGAARFFKFWQGRGYAIAPDY